MNEHGEGICCRLQQGPKDYPFTPQPLLIAAIASDLDGAPRRRGTAGDGNYLLSMARTVRVRSAGHSTS